MPTRLQLARAQIIALFESQPQRVYGRRELERVLAANREEWRLARSMSFAAFLEYLLKSRKLRKIELPFPHRKELRYTWGEVPIETVLLTLKPDCHFSHFTALQLHELTEQDPRIIYLNHEQRPKPPPATGLAQDRIDLAFRRNARRTRNVAIMKSAGQKGVSVCLLNGKHTGYRGVVEREVRPPGAEHRVPLRVTDVERTLIDAAVRPFYAGGVAEVLKAYRRAAADVSVNRLAGMLRKLGYVYPYHQAVGFYLDAAGTYSAKVVEMFHEQFEYDFDFYLTYAAKDTEYVPRWRIHVPRGL